MNIFEALHQSHDIQRGIAARLRGASEGTARHDAFAELKHEMASHETAEERAFYVPLFENDDTVDEARHGVSEHHEMDEMVERLEKMAEGSADWQAQLEKLLQKLEHHLREEEEKFFAEARKVLDPKQCDALGTLYREEHDRLLEKAESEG